MPQPPGATTTPLGAGLSCPGGSVNSGTADFAGGKEGATDVRAHAAQWAKATGFGARFPGTTLTVQEGEQIAVVTFEEHSQSRARLTYRKVDARWAIDTLEYC